MDERFSRSARILGEQKMEKLNKSSVIVFGIGGVGGAALEALVRGGVGTVAVVDKDTVDITNINRQIIATSDNVGEKKVDVAEKRALSINPKINFKKYDLFYLPETAEEIDLAEYDFIVDAIDNVTAKLELIERANRLNVPIISSMGTGNKLHPELFEIADINKTSVCPLARVMRRELKNRGVKKLTVVYSKEEPIKTENSVPGSVSFTPPVAGYLMAGYVINKLLEEV
ncbi:MAG: tRNA threonylcarbamoyladenosine dehydratase [Acutalibacteraceae bacterium]|nr:tRNA threonylcarbamoyladenosine dehydratase [Acutalibacteraceae bacterium]